MRVACIGSRDLLEEELELCEEIGRLVVGRGFELHSGNAAGADQAYARGGNAVDPQQVHLHLPSFSFNLEAIVLGNHIHTYPFEDLRFYATIAADCHPKWDYLKDYVRKLHIRNASLLVPEQQNVDVCIAWPSFRLGGGGTGQGMRIAKRRGIELIDLTKTSAAQAIDWLQQI